MVKAVKKRRKHIPQRTCVGCRTVQEKRTLTRIVRTADGVQIDTQGKLPGRGAYLHNTITCWQLGLSGRLAHALKTEISADDLATLQAFRQLLPPEEEN